MTVMAMVSGKLVKCLLKAVNFYTVWVQLPDGHIIKRRNRMVIMPRQRA
jgi:hypothetical protein